MSCFSRPRERESEEKKLGEISIIPRGSAAIAVRVALVPRRSRRLAIHHHRCRVARRFFAAIPFTAGQKRRNVRENRQEPCNGPPDEVLIRTSQQPRRVCYRSLSLAVLNAIPENEPHSKDFDG